MLPLLSMPLAARAAPDDVFHPGPGADVLSYADLARRGVVRGRTGRVLVRAKDAATIARIPGVAGVTPLPGGLLRVTPSPGTDDLALARALHDQPGVEWAAPDLLLPLRPAHLPDDPLVGDQWHLENTGQGGRTADIDIDAEPAWSLATGAGVTIAVLDSGVETDHPDLSVIAGHDYIEQDDDPNPDFSDTYEGPHGTCASGIAAAIGNNGTGVAGVAYDADVYAIRLIGGETSTEDLYDAFVEAVDAGSGVLSNSWGYGTGCDEVPRLGVFGDMFQYAEEEGRGGLGSVVVFAAGNGNCDTAGDGMLAHRQPIVVAAVESDGRRAWYSNYGDAVDIAAPTTLLTTDLLGGGYGSYGGDDAYVDGFNGTSAATPVVAGVAALMIEANPRITAAQIRDAICRTAMRTDTADAAYDDEGRSPLYGCGLIDAGAAVAAVADTEPSAPTPRLTTDEALAGRVLLAWDAAEDPDGDVLGYEVAWWTNDDADATSVTTTDTALDIGPEVSVGETVSWHVRAADPWGDGPWSETETITVVAEQDPPTPESPVTEDPGGCATAPAPGLAGLVALALLARRR
jgi:subtilisin family serine protease